VSKDRKRLQIDSSPEEIEALEKLRDRIGAKTNAEAFRRAVKLLEFIISSQEGGKKLAVVDENGQAIQLIILL
jgi:hypothetical protein